MLNITRMNRFVFIRNWLQRGKSHLDSLVLLLMDAALEKDAIVKCDVT